AVAAPARTTRGRRRRRGGTPGLRARVRAGARKGGARAIAPAFMTTIERLQAHGIRRLGTARTGFRYRLAPGGSVSASERARIAALRIPPAWTDVAIAPSPDAAVQAVGRDAKQRWQYRYHERQVVRRERLKQER